MASATYYLDFINGNDGNTGLSIDQAKLTVSAVGALQAGGTIGVFDSGIQVRVVANGGSGSSAGFYLAGSGGYGTTWVAVTEDDETFADWDLSTDAGLASFLDWYANRPTFDGGGSGQACPPNHALTMIGIIIDDATDGVSSSSTTVDYEQRHEWLTLTNISAEGITNIGDLLYSGSWVKHSVFDGVGKSCIRISGSDDDADLLVQGNLMYRCGTASGSGSVVFLDNGAGSTVEHNTIYGGAGVTGYSGIWCDAGVVQNNIVVDAGTTYGVVCTAGTERYNCVYTSNSGTWHSLGNFNGAAGTGSIEVDPEFTDVGTDDYTISITSPCAAAGTALATLDYDLIGVPYQATPSMGAYAVLPVPYLQVRGSHELLLGGSEAWTTDALDPDAWAITGGTGEAPYVASVTPNGDSTELTILTDRTLVEGTSYTLTTTALYATAAVDPFAFVGLRKTRAPRGDEQADLVDIEWSPNEDMDVTIGGDRRYVAGLTVVRRMVLDRLLTIRGTLPWSPDYGSDLPHKRLRPLDTSSEAARIRALLETVPRVTQADVELIWEDGHMQANVRVETDLGRFDLSQEVA